MKFITKAILGLGAFAAVAVPVGTTLASAAAPASAAVVAYHAPANITRDHTITLKSPALSQTYTYKVALFESPNGQVQGWLQDPYVPAGQSQFLPLSGLVTQKGDVSLVVNYPAADGNQGARFFNGLVVPGHPVTVAGPGDETGAENLAFTWTLTK